MLARLFDESPAATADMTAFLSERMALPAGGRRGVLWRWALRCTVQLRLGAYPLGLGQTLILGLATAISQITGLATRTFLFSNRLVLCCPETTTGNAGLTLVVKKTGTPYTEA